MVKQLPRRQRYRKALLFVSLLLFPVTLAPIVLMPLLGLLFEGVGWAPARLVNMVASALLLVVLILCYRLSLPALGDMLQRRERAILEVVAREVE